MPRPASIWIDSKSKMKLKYIGKHKEYRGKRVFVLTHESVRGVTHVFRLASHTAAKAIGWKKVK